VDIEFTSFSSFFSSLPFHSSFFQLHFILLDMKKERWKKRKVRKRNERTLSFFHHSLFFYLLILIVHFILCHLHLIFTEYTIHFISWAVDLILVGFFYLLFNQLHVNYFLSPLLWVVSCVFRSLLFLVLNCNEMEWKHECSTEERSRTEPRNENLSVNYRFVLYWVIFKESFITFLALWGDFISN